VEKGMGYMYIIIIKVIMFHDKQIILLKWKDSLFLSPKKAVHARKAASKRTAGTVQYLQLPTPPDFQSD